MAKHQVEKLLNWLAIVMVQFKNIGKECENIDKMIHFQKWISASDIDSYKECPSFTEFHEDALVRELVHNKYIICGDTHQSEDLIVFHYFLMVIYCYQ